MAISMQILMCPPDHYDIEYEINVWMNVSNKPNRDLASRQWEELYTLLNARLDVDVEMIAPHAGLPDMVFTANAGIVNQDKYIPSRYRHAERSGESQYYERWFVSHGYRCEPISNDVPGAYEGEGDSILWRDMLLCGYGFRSDVETHNAVSSIVNRRTVPLTLVDSRWYQLNTCLLPLNNNLIAFYPDAFDKASQARIERLDAEKIVLTEHDALNFAANAIVFDKHVVLQSGSEQFENALKSHGIKAHPIDLSEYKKAGGSCKCMALTLN